MSKLRMQGLSGTWVRLGASLVLLGCQGGGGNADGGEDGSGGVMSVDDGGSGSSSADDSTGAGSGTEGGAGDADEDEGGLKYDIGTTPDGGIECGELGGSGGGTVAFSYIWIGNSPDGTVSKIDTETGVELGRYRTSAGSNSPSRTSVNQFGDVALGNRGDDGSITKIAAQVEHCVDANNDGVITTSTGPNDVYAWGEDECVLWNLPVPSNDYERGPRAIAWEGGEIDPVTCENTVPDPRVWVSWRGAGDTIEIRRLDGNTGAVLDIAATQSGGGRTYGGAVNGEGDFWIATRGGQDNLIHTDAETLEVTVYDVPNGDNYGMAVDANGDPWVVTYNSNPNYVYRLDVATGTFVEVGQGDRYRGIQIDREGRAWIAGNSPCRISLADATTDTMLDDAIEVPGCETPVGISIDRAGFVWMVDQGSQSAFKIDPETRQVVLTVEGLIAPYTYSDMTGAGLDLVINPPG